MLDISKNDQAILNLMKKKVKKGGILYLFLPVKMFCGVKWTKQLDIIGVELNEIKTKCKNAGFKIKKFNMLIV